MPMLMLTFSKPSTPTALKSPSSGDGKTDIYQQDGDFIKDIEVNDLRNRYTLTKGATQKMVIICLLLPADIPGIVPLRPGSLCLDVII